MSCRKVQKRLSAYVDDRLEAADREAVDAHLRSCKRCAEELEIYLMSSTALQAMGPAEPPADLAENAARVAFTHEPAATASGWDALLHSLRYPAMGTAVAAVALAIGLSLSLPRSPEAEPSRPDPVAALMSAGDLDEAPDFMAEAEAVLGEEE